jgi:TfoX/Sxy family transcriptional regulator of competence genes
MGMKQCKSDPCVFYKHDEQGKLVLMAVIHVDDTLLTGTPEWIEWFKKGIDKWFGYTDQ